MSKNPFNLWLKLIKLSLHRIKAGGHSGGETPVPVPNTEVKPSYDQASTVHKTGNLGSCQLYNPFAYGAWWLP